MSSKQTLKIVGTILILIGIFGYLFPHWPHETFSNNENLFHIITGLAAVLLAEFSANYRRWALIIFAIAYLALGVYGMTFKNPADFRIHYKKINITATQDLVDNWFSALVAVAFAYPVVEELTTKKKK